MKETSLAVVSQDHYFRKHLFSVQIVESDFHESVWDGNGGALYISSDVDSSKVSLLDATFQNTKAHKKLSSQPGSGGAVYIEGTSVTLSMENCLFVNTSAVESGSAVYASEGVTVTLINSTFLSTITQQISPSVITVNGKLNAISGGIKITNGFPNLYSSGFKVVQIETLSSLGHFSIQCPPWYHHVTEYNLANWEGTNDSLGSLRNLLYECRVCSESYYTVSAQQNTISYRQSGSGIQQSIKDATTCEPCPYGGLCSGNNVVPRPNYWGFWHGGELVFQQCPAGYCCSGGDNTSCTSYNTWSGNKTDILCGLCQAGFSVSILSGECTPDSQCGGDSWFWLLAIFAALAYAMWYTFKDDIFTIFFKVLSKFQQMAQFKTKPKRIEPDNSELQETNNEGDKGMGMERCMNVQELNDLHMHDVEGSNAVNSDIPAEEEYTQDDEDADDIDKGYFGIVTYYVQMAAVITIQIEFSDINKSQSFLDKAVEGIGTFLNLELTQLSFNVCPILGLTTVGKHIYKLLFLLAIYVTWLALYIINFILMHIAKQKALVKFKRNLDSFNIKLIKGLIEIIKYTYAGFCGIIFMSVVCSQIGDDYVWWYQADNVCLENWQILMVIFGICYAIPFPVALYYGMKQLRNGTITALAFILCCLCPIVGLYFMLIHHCVAKGKQAHSKSLTETDVAIMSVLQGPYREDEKHMTLYWEAMVSIRRLLITAMTLCGYASIRMIIITIMCHVFLCQHIYLSPFAMHTSNHVETLSLALL